jgi:hypothetical protein
VRRYNAVDVLAMIAVTGGSDPSRPAAGQRRQWTIQAVAGATGELPDREVAEPRVVRVTLSQVDRLASVRVYVPKDLRPVEARERAAKSIGEVRRCRLNP